MIDRIYMRLSKQLNSGKEYFRICPSGSPLCPGLRKNFEIIRSKLKLPLERKDYS
jgi:hypothetical protein